jgi:hypothetical protein
LAEGAKKKNAGLMAALSAGVAAWIIYGMATATEAPSQALSILNWILLICAVVGCIGCLMQMATTEH